MCARYLREWEGVCRSSSRSSLSKGGGLGPREGVEREGYWVLDNSAELIQSAQDREADTRIVQAFRDQGRMLWAIHDYMACC